ncbi:MAG: hypothetical protein ACLUNV_11475 [Sutterella wadsworthensis]
MPLNGFHALGVLAGERTRPGGPSSRHHDRRGQSLMAPARRPSAVKLSGLGRELRRSPHVESRTRGQGAEAARARQLSRAGLPRRTSIVYVNLHGATGQNDASGRRHEPRLRRAHRLSSTKPRATLGPQASPTRAARARIRCGAELPAQFSEGQTPDETLPLSGVLREPALIAPGPVMSTNLAFGGSNTALIFEPTS